MPQKHEIEVRWFDNCFSDYITDWSGIVVGIERNGQTRDELIATVADEAVSHEDFPLGDHAFDMLKRAIADAIPPGPWNPPHDRLWPIDTATGTEIQDPESDAYFEATQGEQPCAWFRVIVTSEPLRVALDNQGGDHHEDGTVLVTCNDRDAAADDGYIDGSSWETPRDMLEAYTILTDRPTLVAELTAQGYDVDCSCYCEPDADDIVRWSAKYEREAQ